MAVDPRNSSPVACLLTPAASGGIAVIEVRGPGAVGLVARVFQAAARRDWTAGPPGRLYYGRVVDGGRPVDEVIIRPRGRGGPGEAVEVNCHGGVVAAGEIMRLLEAAGAREISLEAYTARRGRDRGLDAVQIEALRLLPLARTKRAVQMLCDQLNGALSAAASALAEHPDAAAIRRLSRSAGFGRALVEPRRVALVGRPNVGKSTLFNALVGHHRTIVSATPGTTRDYVDEFIAVGGYPLELIDTAGLWEGGGVAGRKGMDLAGRVSGEAGIVVLVLDGSRPILPDEIDVAGALAAGRAVAVLNKADLEQEAERAGLPADLPVCSVSAATGRGLEELERALLRLLPEAEGYPPGAAVAFTARQIRLLTRAARLAEEREPAAAPDELRRLREVPPSGERPRPPCDGDAT
ncbi:MAG: GTPase [Planctomycetota bacterium]